ncbi:OmpW family protein [Chitinimonas sp. BJYL2]|uniref:OmpW/AlkL family protein n=1 Tax=Chitinimonas sp. BJYL2 TaxID=2976696 RepID=UPI0022B5311C|nr:OmpW family outer membrane protein [Chitinimonas sp. BJYL2]
MQAKTLVTLICALMGTTAVAAQGDLLVRGRLVQVAPSVSNTGTLAALNVDVDKQTVPELDFTYMLSDQLGAELILGTARHKVTANGASLGKVSHLPPTLTLQYHFAPNADIRPYAGVGVNYTRFYNADLKAGAADLAVDKNSFGGSLQLGADFAINQDWYVNVDVKKIYIKTDVSVAGGAKLGTLKVNPVVWGVGVGTKF